MHKLLNLCVLIFVAAVIGLSAFYGARLGQEPILIFDKLEEPLPFFDEAPAHDV